MGVLLPLISTACIVISAALMAVGWFFIRKGKKDTHMKIMLTASFFALAFFVIYMSRTIFIGNTPFGGSGIAQVFYTIFLIFHIILATSGAVFGVVSLTLAFRKSFQRHRKIGPWTASVWFFTAATGIIVYLLLYVFYPSGTTTNLMKAIFGS